MQFFSRYDMSQTLHESPLEICEALVVGFQAKKISQASSKTLPHSGYSSIVQSAIIFLPRTWSMARYQMAVAEAIQ